MAEHLVPPDLAEIIIGHLLSGKGLISEELTKDMKDQLQLAI